MSDAPRQLLAGLMAKSRSKLAVAFRLHASGDHEDAVSRAYYAVKKAADFLDMAERHLAASITP